MAQAPGDFFHIGWAEEPLQRLAQLREAREVIDVWIEDAVVECRKVDPTGAKRFARNALESWASIGEALGISRAAAWERFHEL